MALDGAGSEVVTAAEGLASVISTLTAALSGCAGMAGDDPAGAALGHNYDNAAFKLVKAMVNTRNGLCGIGIGVRMSAHNYSLAEAMSNIGGNGSPLPAPPPPGPISAGSVPSAVGSSDAAPAGWGWVVPYLGMIWPNGDSAKLRAAATAWNTAGTQFALAEILGTGSPMGVIRAQHIPEGQAIDLAFTAAYRSTTSLVQQCQQIAAKLDSYAAKIDKVHAAILDLLARICDPLTGFKEVWDILTDEDEDEIKKIADDIRTVIDNFKAEVQALEAEIAAAVTEATTIITTMGDYAARQWDQFLHTTPVGRAIDMDAHLAKEFGSEAVGFVKGLYNMSQVRLVLDPIGYFHDLDGMVLGAAPLVGLGPDGSPSVLDSWKAVAKDVSHWDQWESDPVGAFGRTLFDGATLALPGGPLSKLGTRSRAAVDALKGLRKPPLPRLPDPPAGKPPETPKPPAAPPRPSEPAPGGKPPEPGSPTPPPKPGPAPTGTPPPHSPAEPKPPVAPHAPAGKPSVPTEATPTPHEHVPAQAPATAGGKPGELVPAATASSAPAAAAHPAPHAPSAPTGGGVPAETPLPHGGTPHGGEPGAHQPHPPHDGTPHPPDDGAPHQPGDGTPHQPGDGHPPADGTPHEPGDGSPGDQPHDPGEKEPPKAREVFPNAKEFGELAESEYRRLYEDENGALRYPDVDDPAKPYAIPNTAHNLTDAEINALDGTKVDRIGYPGGEWLAPPGTPYEWRSLPHTSLDKPYNVYTIHANVGLPAGWKIELSTTASWFGHPGGGPQYLLIPLKGAEASVQALLDTGFLTED